MIHLLTEELHPDPGFSPTTPTTPHCRRLSAVHLGLLHWGILGWALPSPAAPPAGTTIRGSPSFASGFSRT